MKTKNKAFKKIHLTTIQKYTIEDIEDTTHFRLAAGEQLESNKKKIEFQTFWRKCHYLHKSSLFRTTGMRPNLSAYRSWSASRMPSWSIARFIMM